MADTRSLRPLERRILQLVDEGVDGAEIARRFNRSPEFVTRVVELTRFPRVGRAPTTATLRPVERRILRWRAGGADHADIGRRFHRSAGHIERVEQLAQYKLETG